VLGSSPRGRPCQASASSTDSTAHVCGPCRRDTTGQGGSSIGRNGSIRLVKRPWEAAQAGTCVAVWSSDDSTGQNGSLTGQYGQARSYRFGQMTILTSSSIINGRFRNACDDP
jgi:hypothetical protein